MHVRFPPLPPRHPSSRFPPSFSLLADVPVLGLRLVRAARSAASRYYYRIRCAESLLSWVRSVGGGRCRRSTLFPTRPSPQCRRGGWGFSLHTSVGQQGERIRGVLLFAVSRPRCRGQ